MSLTTWNLSSVTASTETDLVTGTASQTAMLRKMTICNYSGSEAAVVVKVTDDSNTETARIIDAALADEETLDVPVDGHLIDGDDKLRVESDQANVAFYVSGDDDFSF